MRCFRCRRWRIRLVDSSSDEDKAVSDSWSLYTKCTCSLVCEHQVVVVIDSDLRARRSSSSCWVSSSSRRVMHADGRGTVKFLSHSLSPMNTPSPVYSESSESEAAEEEEVNGEEDTATCLAFVMPCLCMFVASSRGRRPNSFAVSLFLPLSPYKLDIAVTVLPFTDRQNRRSLLQAYSVPAYPTFRVRKPSAVGILRRRYIEVQLQSIYTRRMTG
ncbi:hypothetical protein IW262DRAFT_1062710 [Armillaria fumosa]|nr:hypothetical protein IW262DRAFT_1062710 [Armillaria fumosa]